MSQSPVGATHVATEVDLFNEDAPGLFTFKEKGDGIQGILFNCPCGCGCMMHLPIYQGDTKPWVDRPAWRWDGNVDSPTLTPSIRDLSGCKFHGFLTAGWWTFCEDSGSRR